MTSFFLLLACLFAAACTALVGAHTPHPPHHDQQQAVSYNLFVGTENGTIAPYKFTAPDHLVSSGGFLTSAGKSPSWISFSPKHPIIYATDDQGSSVYAILVRKNDSTRETTLTVIDTADAGGHQPIYNSVVGDLLFVANYHGNSAAVLALTANGTFANGAKQPDQIWSFHREPRDSVGPIEERQDAAYPHQTVADPDHRWVYIPDLGADKIHRLALGSDGLAASVKLLNDTDLPPGSGPRHMALYKDNTTSKTYAYLASELTVTLTAFDVSDHDGSLTPIGDPTSALPQGVSAIVEGAGPQVQSNRTTAEVAISPDGRFVYVSHRNDPDEDHISIFLRDVHDGSVSFREWVGSGGRNLRHFSLSTDPDAMYIAAGHQKTGNITILDRNPQHGSLTKTTATLQGLGIVDFTGFATGPTAEL